MSQDDFTFISRFDGGNTQERDRMIQENPMQCARTFYNLLGHISKDQTIQYLLTLVDDFLQEDKNRVAIFRDYAKKRRESVWAHFLNLLNRPDTFIQNMTARIVAKMACWSPPGELMAGSDLQYFLTWLKDQMRMQQNEYVQSVARCLQMMLRIDDYRHAFVGVDGIATIVSVLAGRVNFQIQYQLTFCLWVLSFNTELATKLNKFGVIPILSDVLSDAQKEKVSRIILAGFRNLIEKPEETDVKKENCISMVQCKVLKQLELLEQRKFDDEDIAEDIELLKILIALLETSKDPLVLSVACFDLGEYVRHCQRGKHVLEQLGGKTMVMTLLGHADPNVRYEALLAVQKLMVHNWEYLGKQVDRPAASSNKVGLAVA